MIFDKSEIMCGTHCFDAPGGARAPDTQKNNRKQCLGGGQHTRWAPKVHFIGPRTPFSVRDLFLEPKVHFWLKMQKVASRIVGKAFVFLDICGPGRPSAKSCPKVHFCAPETTFWGSGAPNCGISPFCEGQVGTGQSGTGFFQEPQLWFRRSAENNIFYENCKIQEIFQNFKKIMSMGKQI